jgi:hypothetical protein
MLRRSRPHGAASARARGLSSCGRPVIDQRGRLLMAAVGFATCSMPSYDRALWALRTWLDSWSGIGHVAVGMARQGYDLQLTRYDERGWRATFYTTGTEHSPTSATGTGWDARRGGRCRVRRGRCRGRSECMSRPQPQPSVRERLSTRVRDGVRSQRPAHRSSRP